MFSLQQAKHVAPHRVLEDVQRGQAKLVGVPDVSAAGLRDQASENGAVRHEHEQGDARAEDVAVEQGLGGLVSTRHSAPTAAAAAAALASAAGSRCVGAVAGLPALGRLVAGGGVAHEIVRVHRTDVLAETKVAEACELAVFVEEDVFGLARKKEKKLRR